MKTRLVTDQERTTVSMAESAGSLLMNVKQNAYFLCSNENIAQTAINKEGYNPIYQRDKMSKVFNINTGSLSTPLMRSAYTVLFLDSQFPLSSSMQGDFSMKQMTKSRLYSVLDVQDTDWYRETVSRMSQVYAFWDSQSPQNVFFSHYLRNIHIADPKYSDKIGVVLYSIPKNVLEEILENARITEGSISLLMFENSVFISSDPEIFPVGGLKAI